MLRSLVRSPAVVRAASAEAAAWCDDCERRLALYGMCAALALVVLDVLRLWHQTYAFYGGFEPITLDLVRVIANETLWGSGWKLQAASAVAAAATLGASHLSWPGSRLAAVGTVAFVLASRPLTGHAVEQGSWLSLTAILQVVHVAGAALWLGTLLALLAVGLRRARDLPARRSASVVAALINGFSPLALAAATALFVAGCATSFLYLGSPAALVSTPYGRVFAAKFVAFLGVLGLGWFNWRKVKPRLAVDDDGATTDAAGVLLLRSAAVELAVGALVLLLTAVLVALPMPTG